MWDECGMSRNESGLKRAKEKVRALRAEFWEDARVPEGAARLNQNLEHAGRVADFFEFAELMIDDALQRTESCGGFSPAIAVRMQRRSPSHATVMGSRTCLRARMVSISSTPVFS